MEIQKSIVILYISNEQSENELRESIPFITALKYIKYLGINLIKQVKVLFIEKYKLC